MAYWLSSQDGMPTNESEYAVTIVVEREGLHVTAQAEVTT